MSKQFVGVDPGKSGCMSIIQDGKITSHLFPKVGKEYDIQGMIALFKQFEGTDCHLVIEDVKALQGPMKAGNWSLSRGKTILEMCVVFFNIPFTMVHSKTWQKEIWQGIEKQLNTKDTTLLAIKRLFPNHDLKASKRCSKDHDGITDSIAMAEYCRRKFK